MTPEKYEALINATGGFTKNVKRGDHPQRLVREDEVALSRAWKTTQSSVKSPSKENEGKSRGITRIKI